MSDATTATITSTVNPGWIDLCTKETDLFMSTHCGYWLRGAERDPAIGWLVWESLAKPPFDKEPGREKALAAWRAGKPLPKGWYRLDHETAVRAWGEGVKWRGEKWYENGDANAYDYVLQMALLGEERYG